MEEHRTKSVPLPTGGTVEGIVVDVDESTERWSEFRLKDGTLLRAKPVLMSAILLPGKFDGEGRPIYAIEAAVTTSIVSVGPGIKKDQ